MGVLWFQKEKKTGWIKDNCYFVNAVNELQGIFFIGIACEIVIFLWMGNLFSQHG